jgi:hypothetical protein
MRQEGFLNSPSPRRWGGRNYHGGMWLYCVLFIIAHESVLDKDTVFITFLIINIFGIVYYFVLNLTAFSVAQTKQHRIIR